MSNYKHSLLNPKIVLFQKRRNNKYIIFIPGFLSSPNDGYFLKEREKALANFFKNDNLCLYTWDTKSYSDLFNIIISNLIKIPNQLVNIPNNLIFNSFGVVSSMLLPMLFNTSHASVLNAIQPTFINEIRRLWKDAKINAEIYAKYLAKMLDKIYGINPNAEITLIGHSLGCYLIYKSFDFIKTTSSPINKLYFCGGALDGKSSFVKLLHNVKTVYNVYSKNDIIIDKVFSTAEYLESGLDVKPVGVNPFLKAKVKNLNATSYIDNHSDYWDKIGIWYK